VDCVRYTTVDDVGRAINPMILHGQTHGGIARRAGRRAHRDAGDIRTRLASDPDARQVREDMRSRLAMIAVALALFAHDSSRIVAPAVAQPATPLPTITVSAFNPPSLGAFIPPIIKAKGLDKANGFTLEMAYKPSDTYQVDYASGHDLVGGSATFISEARRASQGVETICLFNVFDYFAAVITANPQIKIFKDLEGKEIAADTRRRSGAWASGS
jgi:hypothetical protein